MNDLAVHILSLTTEVTVAALNRGIINPGDVPAFIASTQAALRLAGGDAAAPAPAPATPLAPAVNPKKSITNDFIICLEDGKKFKSLKRHLKTSYGLTPEEYRAKWGLDADYPMVAPSYAATRSQLAKDMGLGRKSVN